MRVELDAIALSSGPRRGNERRAGAGKGIEDDAGALRAVKNGVGHHGCWLHRRVHGKVGIARRAKAVDAGVRPDVRTVAPVSAEFNIVDVCCPARLEHEYQLMLRAVERTHAAVRLRPDTQVLELAEGAVRGIQNFTHVAPVHADELDRTIDGMHSQVSEDFA